jgi:O-antigen/teichoic acid export membrane protein
MMPILVTSVVSVISVPLYFHVLGDTMYAMWFYVGSLTGAFGFMDLGLGVAVGRYIGVAIGAGDNEAVKEYWATGNAIVLPFVAFFALVFVVLGVAYGPGWFKVTGADANILRWALVWGGFGLFFSYYGQMWNILAQAYLDFKYLSIIRSIFSLSGSLGAIAVALIFRNIAAISFFMTLLGVGQFILLFYRGERTYKLPLSWRNFRKARLWEMLPYTAKTFGQLLAGSLLGSLDRIFLGRLAPAAEFASYGVAQNIGSRISGLSVAIMGPIFHHTSRGVGGDQTKKPADVYRESFNFLFPWYSLTIIGVFFWSGPVTQLWLGAKYGASVGEAFPWVVAALSLNAIANISGAQLGGLNRVGTGLVLQIISALASAGGAVAGWHFDGLRGASIGFFLSRLVWIIQDALVRKCVQIPVSEYRHPVGALLRQTLIVGIIWAISNRVFSDSLHLSICAAVCAVAVGTIELLVQLSAIRNRSKEIQTP